MSGPSLLCIGTAKAGTGFVFDQLEQHPDFWMPPTKELHYLDAKFPNLRGARERGERPGGSRWQHRGDDRDQAFLRAADAVAGQRRDMGLYARLFEPAGDLLTGDITPAYGFLKPAVIEDFATYFPNCRLILLVRHPVDRLWSHLAMHFRSGKADELSAATLDDPKAFRRYLKEADAATVLASKALTRWQQHAPGLPIGIFLFDAIAANPDKARRDILTFLGADPDKGALIPNRKAGRPKPPMPDSARAVMAEYLAEEIRAYERLIPQ